MFYMINFVYADTTCKTGGDSRTKRPGKLWNALKTPVWNIPQVNGFIGNCLYSCFTQSLNYLGITVVD